MKTIKGPAVYLAQFMDTKAPFNMHACAIDQPKPSAAAEIIIFLLSNFF